ncbi:hypothetical protein PRIPAC_89423, partial [Pristionchus pacificus]
ATVVNTVFSVLEVAAVAGVGVACPPLAPVVGGCLAIGGNLVGQAVTKAVEGDQALGYAQGIYKEQLQDLRNELNNNGWLLEENKEMLKDIKGIILSSAEENREMMRDMKKSLIKFEENVNKNFDDLKDFMIEKDFIQAGYSGADKYVVESHEKCQFIHEFLVKLKHTHTNPISSAMEKNVYLSKHIRTHYTRLLSEMVVKVIAIEGFHQGLTIATKKYWPKLVKDAVYENNNDDKLKNIADRIKKNLTGIHTSDGDTWGNLGKAFKYIFNDEKIRPHGFVACGVPGKIEQRLTNDTATIFTEKQQSTMDNPFYFGLSWP